MADFTISGTVDLVGGGGTLVGAELDFDFLLGELSFSVGDLGHRENGLLYTDSNGAFSVAFEVPDAVVDSLQPNGILILKVRPHFPAAGAEVQAWLQGSSAANLQEALELSNGLEITYDLAAARTAGLVFQLRDDPPALDGVDTLRLHLVSGDGFVLATAPARRISDSLFRANVHSATGPMMPNDCWILLHDGASYRRTGFLDTDEVGRVYARTWELPLSELQAADDNQLLLMQVESATGVGTVSSMLPEQISDGVLISRDLDVDFIDGRMRVRGRLGVGINAFQLFEIGRFEAFFAITAPDRALTPFDAVELAEPVDVTVVEKAFDILPGTDLDELGGFLGLESFLADQVATRVRDEIRSAVAEALEGEMDQVFEEIEASLDIADDPEGTAAEVRSTLFLHIGAVELTDDDIEVSAFAGIWHWVTGFASLDCAANTASVMFASRRPLPMFRRYAKTLSDESLRPWMERYEKLSPELARIARRNPLLTARAIRFGFDLLPVLGPKGGVQLPGAAAEEFTTMAREVAGQASPDLAAFVEHASKVLHRGVGRTVDELIRLAADEGDRLAPVQGDTKRES